MFLGLGGLLAQTPTWRKWGGDTIHLLSPELMVESCISDSVAGCCLVNIQCCRVVGQGAWSVCPEWIGISVSLNCALAFGSRPVLFLNLFNLEKPFWSLKLLLIITILQLMFQYSTLVVIRENISYVLWSLGIIPPLQMGNYWQQWSFYLSEMQKVLIAPRTLNPLKKPLGFHRTVVKRSWPGPSVCLQKAGLVLKMTLQESFSCSF